MIRGSSKRQICSRAEMTITVKYSERQGRLVKSVLFLSMRPVTPSFERQIFDVSITGTTTNTGRVRLPINQGNVGTYQPVSQSIIWGTANRRTNHLRRKLRNIIAKSGKNCNYSTIQPKL